MKEPKVPIVHLQIVREREVPYGNEKLNNPKIAADFIHDCFGEIDREQIIVCCVDLQNKPTCIQIIGIGTINYCLVSVSNVFKIALLSNANHIVLFHNHPSGNPTPSKEDIELTRKLWKAGNFLEGELRDHIILGANGTYFSFCESKYWEEMKYE